ncbi:MAG TPA: type II toxin-antitoxin system prevent-host-death family antitoxin [Acidimicrobiales bacterium]|nr:type II toxin-antitoxin system prevent-host-death family antitoxin [Acidimicrobiales bacterium]
MVSVTASEARATLPQLLNRVEAGEEIILTRHGRQIAVILRPDALRVRRGGPALDAAAQVRDRLEAARRAPLPHRGLTPSQADSLIEEIRSGRNSR